MKYTYSYSHFLIYSSLKNHDNIMFVSRDMKLIMVKPVHMPRCPQI